MNCMEYLLEATKEAENAVNCISDTSDFTVERINDINNSFQLKSIAYSLAAIADKLSEEGERDDKSRSDRNAQTDARARGMGTTDISVGI